MRGGQTDRQTTRLPYAVAPPLGIISLEYLQVIIISITLLLQMYYLS